MRILPLLTSILVALALYAVIMERDILMALAGNEVAKSDDVENVVVAATDQSPVSVVAMRSVAQSLQGL